MEVQALRLHPDQDLLNEMLKWANANDIEAATKIIEGSAIAMGLTVVEG